MYTQRGDMHHASKTHPIVLRPRLRAILAGKIHQKYTIITNPTISPKTAAISVIVFFFLVYQMVG